MWSYGDDVLTSGPRRRAVPELTGEPGLLVEVRTDGFVGRIVRITPREVVLRDRRDRERRFGLHPAAFIVDEQVVTLVPPSRPAPPPAEPSRTASGSYAVRGAAQRVARVSRLLVEGLHDAELVERVWGDDLRIEGIVVEVLDGVDVLPDVVRAFGPGPGRRLGVLVDHLVDGSKEARVAAGISDPNVLVTGHPFVDIWAAVKPEVVGIERWPDVPRGEPWKDGVVRALGWSDTTEAWRRIRSAVRGYTDLDRRLVGAVERLIDFVTA